MMLGRVRLLIGVSSLVFSCLALCTLGFSVDACAQTITVFDVPDAGTGPGQGTLGMAINSGGTIVGAYIDANNVWHGFLRPRDGTIATFDVPGAGTDAGQGTFVGGVGAITPAGEVVGTYTDQTGVNHGFLRDRDGAITTTDVLGAGTGAGQGTTAEDINPTGVTAGEYIDSSNVYHGYVRTGDGKITSFDVLNAGTGAGQGTLVSSVDALTPAGALAGFYTDSSGVEHGYLRTRHGAIAEFDAPGAGTASGQGTFSGGINPSLTINGFFLDSNNVFHGFLRTVDGRITEIDVSGAGTSSGQGTIAANINRSGAIAGSYIDSTNVSHGFTRAPDGSIVKFDVPGAGTGAGQGTVPYCNNPANAITGWEVDAGGVYHGFVRTQGDDTK